MAVIELAEAVAREVQRLLSKWAAVKPVTKPITLGSAGRFSLT